MLWSFNGPWEDSEPRDENRGKGGNQEDGNYLIRQSAIVTLKKNEIIKNMASTKSIKWSKISPQSESELICIVT